METEQLTERIEIRATPSGKDRWQIAADADRRKLSDWLRIAADKEADRVLGKPKKKGG